MFQYWDFPNDAPVREEPPTEISDADKESLETVLRLGCALPTGDGEELFIILGLDFGTSSTKVIVRLPYETGEPTIAIPAPAHCRSGNEPYLWQTVVWLGAQGTFRPWPEPETMVLSSLKQGLLQGRSERAIDSTIGTVTRAQAGVAYLTYVIRYVRGWLLRHRPHLFVGRKPQWFVNIGVPVATYDDPDLAAPYRRIGAAALQLAKVDSPIGVESTQAFLTNPNVEQAGESAEDAEELGIAVIPEAAAEMTAFAKSTRGAPGLYLLVDVGAMTLDVCMFRLNRDVDELYSFMEAEVRPLGVDALYWFLSEGKTELECIKQCGQALHDVVMRTKRHRDPRAECWKQGNTVPVFLAGGGAANRFHRERVEHLGTWLADNTVSGGIRLVDLAVPQTMACPEPLREFGRMAVAWGLSYPPMEIGRIETMRQIDDVSPDPIVDYKARLITKDQV